MASDGSIRGYRRPQRHSTKATEGIWPSQDTDPNAAPPLIGNRTPSPTMEILPQRRPPGPLLSTIRPEPKPPLSGERNMSWCGAWDTSRPSPWACSPARNEPAASHPLDRSRRRRHRRLRSQHPSCRRPSAPGAARPPDLQPHLRPRPPDLQPHLRPHEKEEDTSPATRTPRGGGARRHRPREGGARRSRKQRTKPREQEMARCYVVYVGRVPGVYEEWKDCQKQVNNFSSNNYQGYESREVVEAWKEEVDELSRDHHLVALHGRLCVLLHLGRATSLEL